MKYTVKYTHVIERKITCEVEADNEHDALDKARECDVIDSDEEFAPEDGIEMKDFRIVANNEDDQEDWPEE